jgi:hypothetical protein
MHIHTINIKKLSQKSIDNIIMNNSEIRSMFDIDRSKYNMTNEVDYISNGIEFEKIISILDIKTESILNIKSIEKYQEFIKNLPPSLIYEDFNRIDFILGFKKIANNLDYYIRGILYTFPFSMINNENEFELNFYNEYANTIGIISLLQNYGIKCIFIEESNLY